MNITMVTVQLVQQIIIFKIQIKFVVQMKHIGKMMNKFAKP